METRLHKIGTGYGVWAVLENVRMLASSRANIWIRTPIIPGWTDSESNIRAMAEFLRDYAGVIHRWELNAFSDNRRLYPTLGQVYVSESLPAVHPDRLNALADLARRVCGGQIPVVTSGPTLVG
jgi:pyruvate formate lyase activating enzyme